ncbi:MAG: DUF1522 domain-containing protein [Tardiphaga sp.]
MSGITLSSSVRQNLLSLQSTADLLSTTQNRLSTGNKVNSALDNPTNFFTAQGLNNRASDINNLLDGIGNGVQIIQAANTGITSLQKLVDSAKSIANQALQTTGGYSEKSNVSTTITGATADNLLGTTTYTSASALGNVVFSGAAGGTTAATGSSTLGGTAGTLVASGAVAGNGTGTPAITAGTLLFSAGGATGNGLSTQATSKFTDGATLNVNGKTITFKAAAVPSAGSLAAGSQTLAATGDGANVVSDASGNSTVYLGTGAESAATVGDVLAAVDVASGTRYVSAVASGVGTLSGTASTIGAGIVSLKSSTGADLSITGSADLLKTLNLTASTGTAQTTVGASRASATGSTGSLIQDGSTLNVNGKTITFKNANAADVNAIPTGYGKPSGSNYATDGKGNSTVFLQGGTLADLTAAIDLATGVSSATIATNVATVTNTGTASSVASGALKISTGTASDLAITGTGNALAALGLKGATGTDLSFNASRSAGTGGVSGKTLSFTSFNGGKAVDVTFGDGTNGTVKSLNQLNDKLSANNLTATVDASGLLKIAASNDFASSTLGSATAGGAIGGTLKDTLTFTTPKDPVEDATAQATRASLVDQFNGILTQITTTSQDASFNGVNLLGGDTLKLTFNETGKSTLNITGVDDGAAGLGLSSLTKGSDFLDNTATNKVLTTLNNASSTLRAQASAFGSNLSIVQTRQDFSKNLINVLQTGASNLTLADTNEEAANSQALSTRQSIAVSALSLANQSQQGVLQLLR